MKSPSMMSAEIRRKKKEMEDKHDVVDLSGIPQDKTDLDIAEQEEMTSDLGLDTNKPKPRSTDAYSHQALMKDSHDRSHEEQAPDPETHEQEVSSGHTTAPVEQADEKELKRKMRIKAMMSR